MNKHRYRRNNSPYRMMAELALELDSDLLDLLCEDGFLTSSEVRQSSNADSQLSLLRLAFRRGFSAHWDVVAYLNMLVEKRLDVLRIWNDIVTASFRLRAPPLLA